MFCCNFHFLFIFRFCINWCYLMYILSAKRSKHCGCNLLNVNDISVCISFYTSNSSSEKTFERFPLPIHLPSFSRYVQIKIIQKSNNPNSRNGKSKKAIKTEYGASEIAVPRDWDGSFDPQIVPKRSLLAKGIESLQASCFNFIPFWFYNSPFKH